MKRALSPSESAIQSASVAWLRLMGYAPVKIHNEGKRSPRAGALLKAQGLHAGAADIVVPMDGGAALWIEFKSARGSQSYSQEAFEQHVTLRGHRYVLARSLDDVMRAVA